ncbi:MAG: hypothetical protein IJE23_04310 [Tyzzerella sp.]|nr:hypothetical protein [Tyzzerella sp.]
MIETYALKNYGKMFREPEGQLRHKFIVPGSTYSNQLWDWDCWLTNVALRQFVKEDISEYEKGCVINFLEHIDEQGRIPLQITRDTYLPWNFCTTNEKTNIHKPCLAQHAVFIVKNNGGDSEWLKPYFGDLLKFIDYYINNFRHHNGIYFWHDDGAIGVDNDPSTFYRPLDSSGSIYLNCLMYKELEAVCYLGKLLKVDISKYQFEKEHLKNSVQEHCYDEKDGMYYSVDLNLLPITEHQHQGAPRHWDCLIQRIGCWSGFMAMWSGIATQEQAERMVRENLLDEKSFWAPHGVRTLSKYEKMYVVKPSGNPSCWLGPVWGISNYMVFKGLVKYGFFDEAKELAEKTIRMFEKDLENCGEIHEYYDPEDGTPIMNSGFQNWNLLSINMKAWLMGKNVVEEF